MNVDEIIEYLRALSKDAIVKVSVMDKASMARNSIVIDGVVDGGVWCREDILHDIYDDAIDTLR